MRTDARCLSGPSLRAVPRRHKRNADRHGALVADEDEIATAERECAVGSEDEVLNEQRAYYRGRAPEYDEWWQRRGRYDRGEEETREWHRQVARVDAALRSFDVKGDVLELAGGTGWWTERLARTADRLTVVDGRPRSTCAQPAAGRERRRFLRHRRPIRLATGAVVRRCVLLVLAVARAKAPFQFLLEPCAGLTAANRSSVLHRQPPRRHGLQPSG